MSTATLQRPDTVSRERTVWTIDPLQSKIRFSIRHMAIATAHGRFGRFQGTIQFVGDSPVAVEAQIDAATIHTGIARRDAHLRTAEFFDVATFPIISFRSTRVEPIGPGPHDHWRLIGDLTIHGITRSVELAAERTDGPDPQGDVVTLFSATTKISRKDFGVGANMALNGGGGLVIGDEVTIRITVQALEDPNGDQ